jgi:hypothetical protein
VSPADRAQAAAHFGSLKTPVSIAMARQTLETLPGSPSDSTIQRNCAVSEQPAKIVGVTTFEMTWIDIKYLFFNKLRTISG